MNVGFWVSLLRLFELGARRRSVFRRAMIHVAMINKLGILEWTAIALAIGITLVPLVPYGV